MGRDAVADGVLLARVRVDEDQAAFACLYERHAPAVRRFARSLCGNDTDADDITADVFADLLATLKRGRGPSELALPYAFASVRNRHRRIAGRRAHETELMRTAGVIGVSCESTTVIEADVVRTALATLPDDVQMLLWRTEVQDECVDDATHRNGTSAHVLAVHRHRARRALGTAYLAQHAEPDGGLIGLDAQCRTTVPHLAALVRNKIGVRRRRRVEEHIATCKDCALTKQRLELINTRLRALPKLPWTIWTAGFTSTIKAQVSNFLGTSAVSLAGSSAFAMAVLVPTPLSLSEPSESAGSSPSATPVGSPHRHHNPLVGQAATGDSTRSDDTASVPGDGAEEESSWIRLAASPTSASVTRPAPHTSVDAGGSTITATTPADMPPGGPVILGATPALHSAGATGEIPAPIAPAPIEPDISGTGVEQREDGSPSTATPAQTKSIDRTSPSDQNDAGGQNDSNGAGQGNGGGQIDGDNKASSTEHVNGNGNVRGNADDNAIGQGDANRHGNGSEQGKGVAHGNPDNDGEATAKATGQANGQGQGNALGRDNGEVVATEGGHGNAIGHGQDSANADDHAIAEGNRNGIGRGNGTAKGHGGPSGLGQGSVADQDDGNGGESASLDLSLLEGSADQ